MIVGGIEEIRLDDAVNEIYVADNYLRRPRDGVLAGHVRVQARLGRLRPQAVGNQHQARGPCLHAGRSDGQGVRRPPDASISPTTGWSTRPTASGNRIHVTDKQGNFKQEFILAEGTGVGGVDRRRDVLARQGAEVPLYLRPDEQPHLVPQSRRRQGRGHAGQHGRERRPVLRPPHDRHRLQGQSSTRAKCSPASACSGSCPPTVREGSCSSNCPACSRRPSQPSPRLTQSTQRVRGEFLGFGTKPRRHRISSNSSCLRGRSRLTHRTGQPTGTRGSPCGRSRLPPRSPVSATSSAAAPTSASPRKAERASHWSAGSPLRACGATIIQSAGASSPAAAARTARG